MRKIYRWNKLPVYIAEHEGRYVVLFGDENLGSYATPGQAAADVAGGHCFSARSGIDTATLGISEDLNEWQRVALG